jgi:hypothetical protein
MIEHMAEFNMYFRSILIRTLLIVLNLVGVLSCQKFLNDPPEKPQTLQVEMDNKKCLNNISKVFSDYFQQKFIKSEWDETWACMDQSIVEFMSGTRGEKDNYYQASELKRFFKKLFKFVFKKEVSDKLVDELLKLKQSLIGGESDTISRTEFEKLRGFFGLMAKQMEDLNPYLGVLLFRDNLNVNIPGDKVKVDTAVLALRQSILNIIRSSNFSQSTYSLPEIKLLLEEVEKFSGNTDPNNAFSIWRKKFPFMEKLRNMFIGSKIEIKDAQEVEKIWMLLVDAFRSAVYFSKGINKLEFSNPEHFKTMDDWIESNFMILLSTFQWKQNREIQYSDLDYIVDEVSKEEFWPKQLSADTFKISYRRFITRVLDDHRNDKLTALTYEHIVQMRREYQSYQLIQNVLLENVFNYEAQVDPALVIEKLNNLKINKRIQTLAKYTLGEEKLYNKAWEQFLKLINSKAYTRHWNTSGQLILEPSGVKFKWDYRDLWTMNIYRWGVQVLMRGFAEDPKRLISQEYITREELREIYTEFDLFCVEMGIFDSRNVQSSDRSLKEADLFTPSGNGDSQLQFEELVDLFTMMYSGGMVSVKRIYKIAQNEGQILPEIDIFKNHYISFLGFNKILRTHFSDIFSNLPYFSKYIRTLGLRRWNEFYESMLKVSRICPDNKIGIETADERTFATVVNYIEDLFNVYDLNRNQTLDMQEVEQAYARFSTFIIGVTKKRVKESNPTIYQTIKFMGTDWYGIGLNVFKFIIINSRPPSGDEYRSFIWDDIWGEYDFEEADRSQIVKVFATLKAEISTNPPNCNKKNND